MKRIGLLTLLVISILIAGCNHESNSRDNNLTYSNANATIQVESLSVQKSESEVLVEKYSEARHELVQYCKNSGVRDLGEPLLDNYCNTVIKNNITFLQKHSIEQMINENNNTNVSIDAKKARGTELLLCVQYKIGCERFQKNGSPVIDELTSGCNNTLLQQYRKEDRKFDHLYNILLSSNDIDSLNREDKQYLANKADALDKLCNDNIITDYKIILHYLQI